jgi:Multiple myeloma tumor-associated
VRIFSFYSNIALTEQNRGGRADFKWEDVKQDTHRENYLGHSLMARKSNRLEMQVFHILIL